MCGVLCVFSSFTDSYKEGNVTQYGIVTISDRLWPHEVVSEDYKLKLRDFGHAYVVSDCVGRASTFFWILIY
ncbi:hypothetical protein Patl1_25518 [Pistacia atlantica]|uniref:Uncharacterized protein n=1 Tax=Pistacia atlantica TaxID=434234 RepID=A0ACC1B479_9ROSI|nr:hypothetical protein Patl1_25518 [Pistacia atlantica]